MRKTGRSVTAEFVRWLLLGALLLGGSGCAWLDQKQRQLIYRPTPLPAATDDLPASAQAFFLDVPSSVQPSRIALWWLAHPDRQAPTLLYLHGTYRHLVGNRPKIEALSKAGFSVLAVDYRGWGHSSALVPSEQSIVQDAQQAWAELQRREPRPGMRVIYGHSMGSGVAVALASQLSSPADYGALILESAFTSFADIGAEAGFWAGLAARWTTERFAAIDQMAQIRAPLLMLHGAQDRTVPIALGQRLFAAANPPKHWQPFASASHSDLHRAEASAYQSALITFRQRYLTQDEYSSLFHSTRRLP